MYALVLACALLAAAPAAPVDKDKARALYDQGARAYAAGDYERAATAFRAAYDVIPDPSLLYNLGQAEISGGRYQAGAAALRRFLGERPADDRRAEVERLIAVCEAAAAETPAPVAPAPPPPAPIVAAAPAPDRGTGLRAWGMGLVAAGAIAGATAAYFAFDARDKAARLAERHRSEAEFDRAAYQAWRGARRTGWVLGAVSASALIGGGVLTWLGHRRAPGELRLTLWPLVGVAGTL